MLSYNEKLKIAHGVLGSAAWVLFFPLGSILMRAMNGSSTWIVHASVQLFSMMLLTASAAIGIILAQKFHLISSYHSIIGLVLFSVVWIQAFGGFLQHHLFKQTNKRTVIAHLHVWLGRAMVTLGMVNGGLGLKLAADKGYSPGTDAFIAYGVIAGVLFLSWVGATVGFDVRKKQMAKRSSRSAIEKQSFNSGDSHQP